MSLPPQGIRGPAVPAPLFGILFFVLLAWLVQAGRLPLPVASLYPAASVLCFALYGFDKWAAARGGRRVSEGTLHLAALFCGWPGALFARHLFRHKTRKSPFVALFRTTVLLNCAALAAYLDRLS